MNQKIRMLRYLILQVLLLLAPVLAQADCGDPGVVIDQRSEAQYAADVEKQRTRCVIFVLTEPDHALRQGWVEWHHHQSDGRLDSTRLGLYPAGSCGNPAFGRLPNNLIAELGAVRLTALLPISFWMLVNTTRIGWQMRAGLIENPDAETVRKLFTDVGLNANLADQANSLQAIHDLANSRQFQ